MSTAVRLKGLRERRAAITAELRRLGDVVRKEERDLNTEEKSAFDKLKADFESVGSGIRAAEATLAELDSLVAAGEGEPPAGDAPAEGANSRRPGADFRDHRPDQRRTRPAGPTAEQRALSLQGWMRSQAGLPVKRKHVEAMKACGVRGKDREFAVRLLDPNSKEYRDQSTAVGAGGYTIAQGFSGQLEVALKAFGGVREVATVMRTPKGNTIPYPAYDDTANVGELLAENTAAAEQDVTFTSVSLLAYKYSSKMIQVSNELMQDSEFNLEQILGNVLGERIGRAQGAHFTTGTNSSQPQGVVTGASAGITAASATAIAGTEIVRLKHALDPAYRMAPGVGYMCHDSILAALAILVDSNGQPLFTQSFREGAPELLSGFPVYNNQHMQSTIATGTVTVLFGDFKKYIVRDAGDLRMRRLDERYAEADQTAFVGFLRSDGRYINTAAVKKLTQA